MDSIGIPPRILDGDFAGWLREAMAARHVSARGVARRTGINQSTVTRLSLGEQQPTLTTAVTLLRLLNPRDDQGGFKESDDVRTV
ncbi:MAG TPA: helix-turn-helix transcriptional regulator [Candidatus Dormibacteraeota bacterium]|nr:helix-turn-helix transcriptional regulator [Candidatus Dormibacteraeota bacterium]